MDDEALVHTDLNPANLIATPRGLRIVDWAMATKAAPRIGLALLAQCLIGSGHTPPGPRNGWHDTRRGLLDDFRRAQGRQVAGKAERSAAPWVHDLAAWTGQWSAYRRDAARG